MTAVPALFRQHGPNFVHFIGGHQRPMRSTMAGLAPCRPPTLLTSASLARFASESIGGGRLRRVRRILSAQRQLTLQVGNLLFGVGNLLFGLSDLLISFGYLPPEFLQFAL